MLKIMSYNRFISKKNDHDFNQRTINKIQKTTSVERIESFAIDNSNNLDVVLARYANNITISQALYPELSTLEITLRNSINFMLKNLFGENWLAEEVK